MNCLAFVARLALAGLLTGATVRAADLLNPLAVGPAPTDTPVPLRPPESGTITFGSPRKARPAFDWKAGDRVVLLGDSLLAREAELGFLETRLVSQAPDREFQVRNLWWLTNHPLAGASVAGGDWLASLKDELTPLQPTVIGLAFGNDLGATNDAAVDGFRTNLTRLAEALMDGPADARPRLILFSPVGRPRPAPGDTAGEAAWQARERLAGVVGTLATNRNAEFANVFAWVAPTSDFFTRLTEETQAKFPALFDDRQRLTAYGYHRATLALERSLSWRSGNWRFGLMPDGTFREGGFGTRVLEHQRQDQFVRVRHLEDILPSPNPDGFVDRRESTRPQCYIQLRTLAPGRYALRVDGEEVQRATDAEWNRYQVITDGPSWKQAEQLRQLIVEKNAVLSRRWSPGGEARNQPNVTPFTDPALAEVEKKIAAIRKPVARLYEFVRVGDAPTPNAAPATNSGPPKTGGQPGVPAAPAK